jgi:drug/metabolite transporter (DMT)-like permease
MGSLNALGIDERLSFSETDRPSTAHSSVSRPRSETFSGSFAWSVFTLLVRRWQTPALTTTLVIALYAAPVYVPVWLSSRIHAAPIGEVGFQLVYQGVLAVVVAGFLFTRALTALGPMAVTAITAVVPGLTALGAWALLGEPLGIEALAGVGLVSAAMLMGGAQARGATASGAGR